MELQQMAQEWDKDTAAIPSSQENVNIYNKYY